MTHLSTGEFVGTDSQVHAVPKCTDPHLQPVQVPAYLSCASSGCFRKNRCLAKTCVQNQVLGVFSGSLFGKRRCCPGGRGLPCGRGPQETWDPFPGTPVRPAATLIVGWAVLGRTSETQGRPAPSELVVAGDQGESRLAEAEGSAGSPALRSPSPPARHPPPPSL